MLENWSNYQVAHLRSLQEPQGSEPGRGQTTSPTAALTQGGPWNPTQRRARLPREAHLSSRAQTSEHWRSDAGTEFSRTEARPGLYPGLHVLVQSTRSGLNVLIAESTRSCLNSISVHRTWRGLNLPCRRNLVRFKLVWGWSPRRHRSHTCRVSHHWTGGSPLCGNKDVHFLKKKSSPGSILHPHQETERILSLNISTGKTMLPISLATWWSGSRGDPGISYNAAQCPVQTDGKWPDSSIPGFQQEVTTLEASGKIYSLSE